jgi:hypothetical protein
MITHAKIGGTSFGSLPFICNFFLNMQNSQYVDNDVKCHLQRFVIGHLICWQGEGFSNCMWIQETNVVLPSLSMHKSLKTQLR